MRSSGVTAAAAAAACCSCCHAYAFAPTSRAHFVSTKFPLATSKPAAAAARLAQGGGSLRHQRRSSLRMLDSTALFELQNWAGNVASAELTHVSPLSVGIMYGTGLLMSLSPCALSLLPLTIGYVLGTESDGFDGDATSSTAPGNAFVASAAFAAGLATVLSLLGLSATFAGKLFGSGGLGGDTGGAALPLLSAAIAIVAGLNLLELVNVALPSWEAEVGGLGGLPRGARAFALGASSALIASPCCTPVLASILGFVATSGDPLLGGALLLAYSLGYTTPLMVAGTASGALSSIMSASGATWITPVSAAALISYGTFTGLGAIFGPA